MVTEFLNSVWLYSKDLDGMHLIIVMLSHTSGAKVKVVNSSLDLALVAVSTLMMNSVKERAWDVEQWVVQLEDVELIDFLMVVASTKHMKIMIVRILMVMIMLDLLIFKSLEEELVANVSVALLIQDNPIMVVQPSVSNTSALIMENKLRCKLVKRKLFVIRKGREQ